MYFASDGLNSSLSKVIQEILIRKEFISPNDVEIGGQYILQFNSIEHLVKFK